jgi:hypothetical protein
VALTPKPIPCLLVACAAGLAQDPFEIHVHDYEMLKPGGFTVEQHLNYWAIGSKEYDGGVAPSNDQFHMTYENYRRHYGHISLGFMQLNGARPGVGLESAVWRVLPHFYAPLSWHRAAVLGLVTEFPFVKPVFAADARHVEIRPILPRSAGPVEAIFNPVFAPMARAPTRAGSLSLPRAAYGYSDQSAPVPYLEWYSEMGREKVHRLFPGVDIEVRENLLWSLGIGVGLTSAEPRLLYQSPMEFSFGRK